MGSLLMKWWWGGDPNVPNSLSGMTLRDVHTVQRNWASVYAQSGVYGLELFLRLFRQAPIAKTFFKSIRDLSEEDIKSSIQFRAHIHNLMSSFNGAVTNLHQPEVVVVLMNRLGTSHNARKIRIEHFEEFKKVMVGFLKNDLKLDDSALTSWFKFIDFIFRNIYENLSVKN